MNTPTNNASADSPFGVQIGGGTGSSSVVALLKAEELLSQAQQEWYQLQAVMGPNSVKIAELAKQSSDSAAANIAAAGWFNFAGQIVGAGCTLAAAGWGYRAASPDRAQATSEGTTANNYNKRVEQIPPPEPVSMNGTTPAANTSNVNVKVVQDRILSNPSSSLEPHEIAALQGSSDREAFVGQLRTRASEAKVRSDQHLSNAGMRSQSSVYIGNAVGQIFTAAGGVGQAQFQSKTTRDEAQATLLSNLSGSSQNTAQSEGDLAGKWGATFADLNKTFEQIVRDGLVSSLRG